MAQPVITNNSPTTGYIAWTAFTVDYTPDATNPATKVTHNVSAGNTNKRFVIWTYNAGSPVVTLSDTIPVGYSDVDDQLLFVNRAGIGVYAYNTGFVSGGLIVDGSIYVDGLAANSVSATQLQSDAVTATKIAADAIKARNIDAGAVGAQALSIGAYSSKNAVVNGYFEDWDTQYLYPASNLNPNASMEGGSITGYTGVTSTVTASTTWSNTGTYSLRIAPSGASNDSFASVGGDTGAVRLGMTANTTYIVQATSYCPVALTGSLNSASRRIVCYYKIGVAAYVNVMSPTMPATTGSYRHTVSFNVPTGATEAFIRLYHGGQTTGEYVYWDDVTVTAVGSAVYGDADGFAWADTPYLSNTIFMPDGWSKVNQAGYLTPKVQLGTSSISGNKSLTIAATASNQAAVVGEFYPVAPGENYYAKASVLGATGGASAVAIGFWFYNAAGAYVSSDATIANVATTKSVIEHFGTIPVGCYYMVPLLQSSLTTNVTFDNVEMGARVSQVQIANGAITAEKLTLGVFGDNRAPNGGFEDFTAAGSLLSWVVSEVQGTVGTTSTTKSGAVAIALAKNSGVGTYLSIITESYIPVVEDRSYYFSIQARGASAMASGFTYEVQWFTSALASVSTTTLQNNVSLTTTYTLKETANIVAPSTARYAKLRIRDNLASSTLYVDEVVMRENITGNLLVNGAIDGKTITGATVQTSSGSSRMVIRDDGAAGILEGYLGLSGESPSKVNCAVVSSTRPSLQLTSGITPTMISSSSLQLTAGTGTSGSAAFAGLNSTNVSMTATNSATVSGAGASISLGSFNAIINVTGGGNLDVYGGLDVINGGAVINGALQVNDGIDLQDEASSLAAPASGFTRIYTKSTDGLLYKRSAAGVEKAIEQGYWTTWTPTTTSITLGTGGTIVARYTQIGKTVTFSIILTFGTGGTITGTPLITLPVNNAGVLVSQITGIVQFTDAGTQTYSGQFFTNSATQIGAYAMTATGGFGGVTATNPFTWTVNDRIHWAGTYEAA